MSSDLVEEAFDAASVPGLGRAFVCRLCKCVFVSAGDAERHLTLYHRVTSKFRLRRELERSSAPEGG